MAVETLGLEILVEGLGKFLGDMKKADDTVDESAGRWGLLGKLAGGAGDVLGKVAKVGLAAVATGAVAAVGAVGGLTMALGKLAMEAAPVQGLQMAFEGLTADFEGGSEVMLKALQEASGGMVANRDLMMSFNQAAQLVGKDFAQQLPGAMNYLGKVAAATGQDMGYMMDSLVKGVGRLSPMILDNLGIQVNLTEANEAYAKQMGISVGEMTKQQQQAAMMNLVMQKLAENTANMPEVAGSATAGMASLQTQFQNFKDEIGIAFLPALSTVMGTLSELAQEIGPRVVEWAQIAGAWLAENLPIAINTLQSWITGTLLPALSDVWSFLQTNVIPIFVQIYEWLVTNIPVAIATSSGFWTGTLKPALEIAWAFIQEKVVPVLQEVYQWLITNVPKALQKLSQFWTGKLLPALQAAWAFLQENVVPILIEAYNWLITNLPAALQTLTNYWINVLLPALQTAWGYFQNYILPILRLVADVLVTVVGAAVAALAYIWNNVLLPALKAVWEFIQKYIIPLFTALADLASAVLGLAIRTLAAIWKDTLLPALTAAWEFIKKNLIPILEAVAKVVNDVLGPPLRWLAEKILPAIQGAFRGIAEFVVSLIALFKELAERIRNVKVPPAAEEHSPSPLEASLRHITGAVRELRAELAPLSVQLGAMGRIGQLTPAAVANAVTNQYAYYNYNLTTQSVTQPGALRLEFQSMAMATR